MTAGYHDIRRWNADALEDAAGVIRGRKEQVIALQDELDQSLGPLLWHGESATAARGSLAGLRDRAEHLVAEAGTVQRALYHAADEVTALSHLIEEIETAARANGFSIGGDGAVRDDAPGDPPTEGRARLAAYLSDGVSRIVAAAGEIDWNLASTLAKAQAAQVSDLDATSLAEADPTARTADGQYKIGDPDQPHTTFDEDFAYGSAEPNWRDHLAKGKWLGKLHGAQALGLMPDATKMYEHYWENSGEPRELDYAKAYSEDAGIRAGVDAEVTRAARAADELVRSGHTEFPMTGQASTAEPYPKTENWQKAIGGYQVWSHGDVRVNGSRVTMTLTVEAEDRYNFNSGQADIATGAADDENGRFTEIGWARPFDTHGAMTRTVTWEVGYPPEGLAGTEPDAGGTPDRPWERRR